MSNITTVILPRFVDEQGASEITGIPTATLQTKRVRGSGPPFVKVGRSVRYEVDDLVEWMRSFRATSTSDLDRQKLRVTKAEKSKTRTIRRSGRPAVAAGQHQYPDDDR